MKYDLTFGHYTLESGRCFSANLGLLSPGDNGVLFEGYDSKAVDEDELLTAAERAEIAEYMAARWREWGRV